MKRPAGALLLILGACAGGARDEASRTAPSPSASASAVALPEPAPSASASQAAAAPSASASGTCEDPSWWLAYLVTLAKSDDARKLAFVARQTSTRSDELHRAEDALARGAANRDAAARAKTIADVETVVAKNHPACAPPFSSIPQAHTHTDAGAPLGWIDPRVIQHVVRASFGRAKLCYENVLRKDPSSTGRITTKFVIATDGTVAQTSDVSKPDEGVLDASLHECVRKMFSTLTFPPPDGAAAVTVVYPLVFSPSAD